MTIDQPMYRIRLANGKFLSNQSDPWLQTHPHARYETANDAVFSVGCKMDAWLNWSGEFENPYLGATVFHIGTKTEQPIDIAGWAKTRLEQMQSRSWTPDSAWHETRIKRLRDLIDKLERPTKQIVSDRKVLDGGRSR